MFKFKEDSIFTSTGRLNRRLKKYEESIAICDKILDKIDLISKNYNLDKVLITEDLIKKYNIDKNELKKNYDLICFRCENCVKDLKENDNYTYNDGSIIPLDKIKIITVENDECEKYVHNIGIIKSIKLNDDTVSSKYLIKKLFSKNDKLNKISREIIEKSKKSENILNDIYELRTFIINKFNESINITKNNIYDLQNYLDNKDYKNNENEIVDKQKDDSENNIKQDKNNVSKLSDYIKDKDNQLDADKDVIIDEKIIPHKYSNIVENEENIPKTEKIKKHTPSNKTINKSTVSKSIKDKTFLDTVEICVAMKEESSFEKILELYKNKGYTLTKSKSSEHVYVDNSKKINIFKSDIDDKLIDMVVVYTNILTIPHKPLDFYGKILKQIGFKKESNWIKTEGPINEYGCVCSINGIFISIQFSISQKKLTTYFVFDNGEDLED